MTTSTNPTYNASVPVFERSLGGLIACMDKAAANAEERKFGVDVMLTSRLAPDMLSFTNQVQIACDTAKFAVARLTGTEAPKFEDSEKTLADLRERVVKTIAYVKSVPATSFEGAATRDVEVPRRNAEPRRFKGESYLNQFALPNFYFHVATAYGLLRHNGVPLGKMDFLNLG
ncbi:DUF1993 family protein [soil metagenome]